jgi:hypothetical protein
MNDQHAYQIIDLLNRIERQLKENEQILRSIESRLPAPPPVDFSRR